MGRSYSTKYELVIGSCTSVPTAVREHSTDPEKSHLPSPATPELGTCYHQCFCSFLHDMPVPCLRKLAWQDQIAATASICCFLRERGEKLSLKFSMKNSTFHSVPLMIRKFHCSLPHAKNQNSFLRAGDTFE